MRPLALVALLLAIDPAAAVSQGSPRAPAALPSTSQAAPPASAPQAPALNPDIAAGNEAFQKEDWPAAAKSYQSALAKGAVSRLVHFRLGYALHMQKQYAEALKHHLRAVPIANRNIRIDALYNAACANALLGNKSEAMKFLQFAIDAGFIDTTQVERDTDLDSLRADEPFKQLITGIGKAPRLDQQLDALLGTWTRATATGEVTHTLTFSRPLPGSQAIVTTLSAPPSISRTGVLTPNAADRTWTWTSVDGLGTGLTLTGGMQSSGRFAFVGSESTAVGRGVEVHLSLRLDGDSLTEQTNITDSAAPMQREVVFTRRATP